MQPRINSQKTCLLLMAGIFLGGVVLVRLRLLGLPLERDEGEYAYMAQQGKFKEATAHFEKAINIDPNYVDARKNLELARSLTP